MMLFPCGHCMLVIRVLDEEGLSSLAVEAPSCPACGKKVTPVKEVAVDPKVLSAMRVRDLEPQEWLIAQGGLGLPEERDCRKDVVQGLLKDHPVRRVYGYDVPNTQRVCVESLELWDGTRLYFGASSVGAIVYRIVCPPSHTEKAISNV